MAMPTASRPRRTLRMQSSETGPGWAPTKRPRPNPTTRELTLSVCRPLGLQLLLERGQAVVPLRANLCHPRECLRHRSGCRAIEHLAALAPGRDEARGRERAQVLLDRLARDGEVAGELRRGRLATLAQRAVERAACGVRERREDGVGDVD